MPSRVRAWLSLVRAYLLWGSGLLWFAKRRAAARGDVLVLTFHRVLDDPEFAATSSLPGIVVRRRTFADFVEWAGRHCEVVDLGQGSPQWGTRAGRPRIALTFDDGWVDNAYCAQPAATRSHASITVFLCSGLMGHAFPFWPERAKYFIAHAADSALASLFPHLRSRSRQTDAEAVIEQMKEMRDEERRGVLDQLAEAAGAPPLPFDREPMNRTMTWMEAQKMHESGWRIGSHTVNHPILTHIPVEAVAAELQDSRRDIEQRLGSCRMFAYPNGNQSDRIRRMAAEAGYELAFTTEPGFWNRDTDPLRIPRRNVWERKLIGANGRFSKAVTEYSLFWRK